MGACDRARRLGPSAESIRPEAGPPFHGAERAWRHELRQLTVCAGSRRLTASLLTF